MGDPDLLHLDIEIDYSESIPAYMRGNYSLLNALLVDGIRGALGRPTRLHPSSPALMVQRAEEDFRWVMSDSEDEWSFEWVCLHLGVCAERMRRRVLERGKHEDTSCSNVDDVNSDCES